MTAFGGTPSVLRLVFGHARDAGVKLPDLRSVLWLGEAWDPQLDEDIAAVAPERAALGHVRQHRDLGGGDQHARVRPADTWHPLPSQLVHVGDGRTPGLHLA